MRTLLYTKRRRPQSPGPGLRTAYGLPRLVVDRGQDDVKDDEHDDVQTLAKVRSVAEQVWKWADLVIANNPWVNKGWLDLI